MIDADHPRNRLGEALAALAGGVLVMTLAAVAFDGIVRVGLVMADAQARFQDLGMAGWYAGDGSPTSRGELDRPAVIVIGVAVAGFLVMVGRATRWIARGVHRLGAA
ncbi:MAG: hypothetical protein ACYTGC_08350 [Planctomycetota bacterium]|jgi:hypothetical protein